MPAELPSPPPLAEQVERFLAAIRDNRPSDAEALLARHPAIAGAELSVACVLGDEAAVAAALAADRAAAYRLRPRDDWPPLLYACASPFAERDAGTAARLGRIVRALLDAGAGANTFVPWNEDPHAKLPALYFASERGNVEAVRALLERGADPNDGESIYHAAQHDRRECLELLLAHGADLRGRHAHWGNTPLYFNVGHREGGPLTARADRGVQWLLEHGADPEVTSGEVEETALHHAARAGRGPAMIALLLAHGANPSRRRRDGATPYALALRHGNLETAAALAAGGADTADALPADRFHAACAAGDEAAARALLAAHPELDVHGDDAGRAVAGMAARESSRPLELMLALGLPAEGSPAAGDTPLHWAAWWGRPDNVRVLLARGVRVDVRDRQFGCSALAWACHGSANCREADADYIRCVDLLADAGAGREPAINAGGATPERMARPAVALRLAERGLASPDDLPEED